MGMDNERNQKRIEIQILFNDLEYSFHMVTAASYAEKQVDNGQYCK